MSELLVAAVVLLASHFGIASTPLRAWLVARFGERVYLVLYSLIAFAAIGWLIARLGARALRRAVAARALVGLGAGPGRAVGAGARS